MAKICRHARVQCVWSHHKCSKEQTDSTLDIKEQSFNRVSQTTDHTDTHTLESQYRVLIFYFSIDWISLLTFRPLNMVLRLHCHQVSLLRRQVSAETASMAKIWRQLKVMSLGWSITWTWWATLHLFTLLSFASDLWLAHLCLRFLVDPT